MNRTCPLGHTCESCLWQVEIQKTNLATQEVANHKACAITELPAMMINVGRETHNVSATIDQLRLGVNRGNDAMQQLVHQAQESLTHEQG